MRGLLLPRSLRHRPLLAALLGWVALSLGIPGSAHAQGAVKSVHNDWQVRCDTPPGAQGEQCALIQSVTAEDRPQDGRAGSSAVAVGDHVCGEQVDQTVHVPFLDSLEEASSELVALSA